MRLELSNNRRIAGYAWLVMHRNAEQTSRKVCISSAILENRVREMQDSWDDAREQRIVVPFPVEAPLSGN